MPSLQGNSTNVLIRNVDWLRVAHVVGWLTVIVIVYLAMLVLTFLIYGQSKYYPNTIIQWIPASFSDQNRDASRLVSLALILGLLFLMILGTGWQIESLNLGSLHYLYRARIARAYTSVGNKRRFPDGLDCEANRLRKGTVRRVDEALPGDDIPIADYHPHRFGGPLHLINCCINQTRDDRTGNYSADRRGIALTVGPCGFETGAEPPEACNGSAYTSLAEWAAVSGAAVSSGMGFYTRSGVAILLYMSGLRLGYWMRNLLAEPLKMPRWRLIPKYRAVHAEAFGSFPGLRGRYWYASDGGHFENTGVYALVKRGLPLIVLVDAAADPDYLFGDVENLFRKAKIDFDADIEFIDPATLPARVDIDSSWFGTPYSIVSASGPEFMLLARITYCDGKTGCLLIIKPRRTETMPLDVVGYADRNPVFPQESTAHQLFSEQQWESYHALGAEFGRVLTPGVLGAIPELCKRSMTLPVAPISSSSSVTAQSLQPVQPADSRRARVQQTVRTSLGIGVSISALLGVWQAVQSQLHSGDSSRANYFTALKAAAAEVDQNCVVPAKLAAALAALNDASNAVGDVAPHAAEMSSIRDAAKQFCPADDSGCYLAYFPALYESGSIVTPRSLWTWYWTPLAKPLTRVSAPQTDAPDGSSMHQCVTRRDVYADGTNIVQPIVLANGAKAERGTGLANSVLMTATSGKNAAVPGATTSLPTIGPPRSPVLGDAERKTLLNTLKSVCSTDGSSRRLYAHVYQESDKTVQGILNLLEGVNGIKVMGLENVVATAERRGLPPPFVWGQPTFLYPTAEDQPCAEALAEFYSRASGRKDIKFKQLPASLAGTPGNIEFWLPPSRAGSGMPVAVY
ncbi:hypothetical protein [Caballeronia sp. S22]|uniref:hypothetical protein n=1 Tax=Caballeronia sp. S22 TaxID=3137182 RepID=UPI003531011C